MREAGGRDRRIFRNHATESERSPSLSAITPNIVNSSGARARTETVIECGYCGRVYNPEAPLPYDPYGCNGCTRRTIDLRFCQICRDRLPLTANGQRYVVPNAPLCELCGTPKLPAATS
jgi:hypothetical protein